jgi:hydrogenase maturation protein HypF
MIDRVCDRLAREHQIHEIALSGGVFQNVTLLRMTLALLRQRGFIVYIHRLVPPNDGGLALGQAVVAAALTQSIHRKG